MLSHKQYGDTVEFKFQEKGAKVIRANLIYTRNGNARYEEWFRKTADLVNEQTVKAELPQGTTHYFINLIDENNFLRSYPEVLDTKNPSKSQINYAQRAISVEP